ncbi:MAG TPA: metal ABC transporter ATP-binding protein [Verrucomicrobiota bacterium]|nr:metal ABC transporter ATP-binding protein [Verrucomicrobiota bacterium]
MKPAAADPVVDVRDVCVRLGGRLVLDRVTLRVDAGELVALIGPNGAGKTTLLRALLGLQAVEAGAIRLFGESRLARALPQVGYVPQRLAIERSFHLTVREFLALRAPGAERWFLRPRAATAAALGETARELGVDRFLEAQVATLSGGQLQRVLIAFSLLGGPRLLLLDEPTAGVDAPGEQTFYELIADVQRRRGLTVILVSHDLSLVHRHATWVCALNGRVCCEGRPDEVIRTEALRAAFGLQVTSYAHHHGPHDGHVH